MPNYDVVERLKAVSKWYARGYTVPRIAEKLGCSPDTIRADVKYIELRMRDGVPDEQFIKDFVARTHEELRKLDAYADNLNEMLDWATKIVVRVDSQGEPIYERDPETGEQTGKPLTGMQRPGYVPVIISQLSQISKQRAELLKLVGEKTSINFNVQFYQTTQNTILEIVREQSPELYGKIYDAIAALRGKFKKAEPVALPPPTDVIDAEYKETENAV